MLTMIDEYTRECLAIRVARRLGRYEVINGSEFVAEGLRRWLAKLGTGTLYIEPGSPWENGYSVTPSGQIHMNA